MRDKFGETDFKLTGADANNPVKVAALLKGKSGIYVTVNIDARSEPIGSGFSGHVDAIINGRCVLNAHTTPPGGLKSIRIWVLK